MQHTSHSMRIIALPLSRVKKSWDVKVKSHPHFDANAMLVFYHFDLVSPCGGHKDAYWHSRALKSAVNRAADLWTNLGKAPKGSWKLWTYQLGSRIIDKTEFEELSLGNVDPSLGPTIPLAGIHEQVGDVHLHSKIPLIYPPSLYPACSMVGASHPLPPPLVHLQALLASREPRHRKGFYLWMLATPLTFPIALIPLIPNFPLFYCVWRSWSHYRVIHDIAYRSSQYLSSLLEHGLIEPDTSSELDKLYASFTPSLGTCQGAPRSSEERPSIGNVAAGRESEDSSGTRETRSECIILTHEAIPHILDLFRLPGSAAGTLYHAITQTRGRLGES